MTNKLELYKCNVCGNVIEVLISGEGHPVCCGEKMEKLEIKNDNINSPELTEKHSPIISYYNNGNISVKVENHPMEKKHYIQFMQIMSDDNNEIYTKFFYPNDEVKMAANLKPSNIKARSYCNIHGVYKNIR